MPDTYYTPTVVHRSYKSYLEEDKRKREAARQRQSVITELSERPIAQGGVRHAVPELVIPEFTNRIPVEDKKVVVVRRPKPVPKPKPKPKPVRIKKPKPEPKPRKPRMTSAEKTAYMREWRRRNKRKWSALNRKAGKEILGGKCIICGSSEKALLFKSVDKVNVSNLLDGRWCDRLVSELKRCVLVCNPCNHHKDAMQFAVDVVAKRS